MIEDFHNDLRALSWPELSGLMAAAHRMALSGTMRVTVGETEPQLTHVLHRSPDHIRLTRPTSDPLYIANEHGHWTFDRPGEPPKFELTYQSGSASSYHETTAHLSKLVGRVALDDYWWSSAPDHIEPGARLGRPTWEYDTRYVDEDASEDYDESWTERVAVDATTGIRLFRHLHSMETERTVEFVDFTPEAEIADDLFQWDGPVRPIPSTAQFQELLELPYAERAKAQRRARVPSYWPGGVGVHSCRGNWISGSYLTLLHVPAGRHVVQLDQRPADGALYEPDWATEHVYRWTADDLQFTLVAGIPIAEEELRRIRESMVEIE